MVAGCNEGTGLRVLIPFGRCSPADMLLKDDYCVAASLVVAAVVAAACGVFNNTDRASCNDARPPLITAQVWGHRSRGAEHPGHSAAKVSAQTTWREHGGVELASTRADRQWAYWACW